MSSRLFASLGAVLLAWTAVCAPPVCSQDFESRTRIDLRITSDADAPSGYRLTRTVETSRTVLTERAADVMLRTSVQKSFYETMSGIRSWVNGEALDDETIKERRADPANVFISDFQYYQLRFPGIEAPGDSLRYRYKQIYSGPEYAPVLRMRNDGRWAAYAVHVHHPDEVAVSFEAFVPGGDVEYTVTTQEGTTVLQIEGPVEARPERPYDPFPNTRAAFLPTFETTDGALTPRSPSDFTEWYLSLLAPNDAVEPADPALVDSLVAGASTARDSVAALYRFAQRDVRYIADFDSVNAIVPRAPQKVAARKYGDCKDKANFIAQTAQAMGLDVHMALITTAPTLPMEGEHVHHYNHVINVFRGGDRPVYFDPTHRHLPFGALAPSDLGRRTLILDPDDPSSFVLESPYSTPSVDVTISTSLAEPGAGMATATLRRDAYAQVERVRETRTDVDVENALASVINSPLYKINVEGYRITEHTDSTLTAVAQADLSNFMIASPTRVYVPKTPLQIVPQGIAERAADDAPVRAPYVPGYRLTLSVNPEGYALATDSLMLGVADGPRFAARTLLPDTTSDRPDASALHIEYQFAPGPIHVTGPARSEYLTFSSAYSDAKREMFIFPAAE